MVFTVISAVASPLASSRWYFRNNLHFLVLHLGSASLIFS
jgi:hypothetical protein